MVYIFAVNTITYLRSNSQSKIHLHLMCSALLYIAQCSKWPEEKLFEIIFKTQQNNKNLTFYILVSQLLMLRLGSLNMNTIYRYIHIFTWQANKKRTDSNNGGKEMRIDHLSMFVSNAIKIGQQYPSRKVFSNRYFIRVSFQSIKGFVTKEH